MANHDTEIGSYQSYIFGFTSSILLTLFSFYLVDSALLPPEVLYLAVGALAITQLFVQLVCFLHLNRKSEASWNLLSLLFTLVMVLVLVLGTLWIMYNLYAHMG